MSQRRTLVGPDPDVSVRRQCEILALNRSSLYYESVGSDPEELELMRRIDALHLKYPFFGSRRISQELRTQGMVVNRKRVQRLMRIMDLEGVAPKPNTSRPAPEHPVFPYLLRNLTVSRPNQVWAADITYIPLARGFAYLVAFGVVIVGGLGSIVGSLVGGVLLGITQVLAGTYFGPSAQLVAGYMLILFVLAVRPQGLFARRR